MATERKIPGGPFVNETATKQRQIPGGAFVNETVSAAAATFKPAWARANNLIGGGANASK